MKRTIKICLFVFIVTVFIMTGCKNNNDNDKIKNINSSEELSSFFFDTILVYCPTSMEKAVMEIKNIFEEKTGCRVQVNVADENDLFNEVKSKTGDVLFFSESEMKEELSKYVDDERIIVGHMPVLAVKKGDFSDVNNLEELLKKDASFLIADKYSSLGEATEDFMDMYMKDYTYYYKDNIEEAMMYSCLEENDKYAAVVWKESVDTDKFDIIEDEELKGFYKIIRACKLKSNRGNGAANEFIGFLTSEEVKEIWEKYGYIVLWRFLKIDLNLILSYNLLYDIM